MIEPTQIPRPARERGKIAPEKLAHVVFRTANPGPMIEWYKTVLEAEVMVSTPMASFLTYDEEHHRIAIVGFPGLAKPAGRTSGLEHIAFTYRDADDLFATYERLRDLGLRPYWTINHGPTLSFYYRDPDGNQCELQIDLQATAAETNAWLASSDFTTNPIGVKFDPDDLIARHRAGAPAADLFRRPVIDPSQVLAQLPGPPAAEDGPDGVWATTLQSPMGERNGQLTLSHQDGVLTGHVKGQLHDQPIARGRWANGVARWELEVEQPIKATFVFEARLIEGRLEGTVQFGAAGEGRFVATRADAISRTAP